MSRILFLGGLGRSGTTLVERILGELPGVVALGEVVHLWQRGLRDGDRCGCGEPFLACPFWRRVGDHAFGGWHAVDVDRIQQLQHAVERTRHIPRLALRRLGHHGMAQLTEYADYYRRVYTAAAEVAGASLVVDSSKHSALAWCLSQAGLDVRVAHLVRDPRGVAHSWTTQVVRPEAANGSEMTRYRPGRAAVLWTAHNAALDLLARRGVPVQRLRYEHFLTRPRTTVRALARFAGLAPAARDLSFLTARQVVLGLHHSIAGNPMRFTVGAVPLRQDDAWRQELPARHRLLVGAVCAPLLAAYGYPLRDRSQADPR